MTYSKSELEVIRNARADLRKIPIPSLDAVIVEFLKKFEVFVSPVTSQTKKRSDAVAAGVITGAFGADVGGDAFIFSGQKKQTQVQEWTTWKQWALAHQEFPKFKESKIDKAIEHNEKVDQLMQSEKVVEEIKIILSEHQKEQVKDRKFLLLFFGIVFLVSVSPIVFQRISNFGLGSKPSVREQLMKIEMKLINCNNKNGTGSKRCDKFSNRLDQLREEIKQ